MHASLKGRARRFRDSLTDTRAVQERVLSRILEANLQCEYGRRHGFARIDGPVEFAHRVPIVTYEDLRTDIERIAAGEPGVLVSNTVSMFEETGGSSGGHKLIPYTAASLNAFRAGLLPWVDDLFTSHPSLLEGSAYWSISPAGRAARRTAGGIPIGMGNDASYFGEELAVQIARSLSVPPEVGEILDIDEWRRVTAQYLLADQTLSLVSVWSPTFLLELLAYMDAQAGETLDCSRVWPRLRVISCWDQGSSKAYAAKLKERFPHATLQGKGLLATEGLISIPLTDSPWPVLAVGSGYFEFLDADGKVHGATQLHVGERYEVLLTNDSGLYRYRIGDRVLVRGWVGTAPALEFLGRAGVSSDLAGEKLTDDFVVDVLAKLGLRSACVAPDSASGTLPGTVTARPGYVLLADSGEVRPESVHNLARSCDLLLAANPQYAYARALNQLEPVRVMLFPRLIEHLTRAALKRGQRLGDIKPPALIGADWREILTSVK